MRSTLLAVAAVLGMAVLLGASTADEKKSPQSDKKLEGTWKLMKLEIFGKPPKDEKQLSLTFKGSKVTKKGPDGKDDDADFKVDTSKTPHQIDIIPTAKAGKGLRGIYEVKGDTLRLCLVSSSGDAAKDVPRPTEFTSKEAFLLTLKRQ